MNIQVENKLHENLKVSTPFKATPGFIKRRQTHPAIVVCCGLLILLVLIVSPVLTVSSARSSNVASHRSSAPAPGNVTARARATFSTTTTETFTLTAQVFSGSTDCTSGGGSPTTLNNVGQSGYTLALAATDSVLFTAAQFSDQSNEVVISDLSGRFTDWLVPIGQTGGLTFPGGLRQVCVQGLDAPNVREVDANYSPVIQLRDPTCTTQLTAFHPGDTVCLEVLGGLVDGPSQQHLFGHGGTSSSSTECTFLPIPPAYTPVPVTGDPSTFIYTFPSSNADIPASCATFGNTTDIRGPWRVGVTSPDGNGARAIKTFELTDPAPACSLSCPPNVNQANDAGLCGAIVNYTTPAGAGCGTVTCSQPSGSFFPVGTTPVTCTSSTGPSCSFNVTVNDTENPTIVAPAGFTVGTDSNSCVATGVALGTPTTGDNCSVSSVSNDAPATFPLGPTTVTWTVADNHGHTATATQVITVVDNQPPTITLNGNVITLWPPNHKYTTVGVAALVAGASDNCDAGVNLSSVYIEKVTSDEADNGNGEGNTPNDIVIAANCKSVQLRAEREGGGNGRVYTITFKVRDASGNAVSVSAKVTVPQNQNGAPAVDDGPVRTVVSDCP
jgi:hypothetical protein